MKTPNPVKKPCSRCGGKKFFKSAIGLIDCEQCGGSGKGDIDFEWLLNDWRRLKKQSKARAAIAKAKGQQ